MACLPDVPELTYEVEASDSLLEWDLPSIRTDLTGSLQVEAEYRVDGYYYAHDMQPNLIEVWSERLTRSSKEDP